MFFSFQPVRVESAAILSMQGVSYKCPLCSISFLSHDIDVHLTQCLEDVSNWLAVFSINLPNQWMLVFFMHSDWLLGISCVSKLPNQWIVFFMHSDWLLGISCVSKLPNQWIVFFMHSDGLLGISCVSKLANWSLNSVFHALWLATWDILC